MVCKATWVFCTISLYLPEFLPRNPTLSYRPTKPLEMSIVTVFQWPAPWLMAKENASVLCRHGASALSVPGPRMLALCLESNFAITASCLVLAVLVVRVVVWLGLMRSMESIASVVGESGDSV